MEWPYVAQVLGQLLAQILQTVVVAGLYHNLPFHLKLTEQVHSQNHALYVKHCVRSYKQSRHW